MSLKPKSPRTLYYAVGSVGLELCDVVSPQGAPEAHPPRLPARPVPQAEKVADCRKHHAMLSYAVHHSVLSMTGCARRKASALHPSRSPARGHLRWWRDAVLAWVEKCKREHPCHLGRCVRPDTSQPQGAFPSAKSLVKMSFRFQMSAAR